MRGLFTRISKFFFPPPESPRWLRILPYALLGVLTLVVFGVSGYIWERTNSPEFCGTACHTMPPEYTTYLISPHARVDCVECHIGRGFIATQVTRKAGDIKHIVSMSLAFKTYEFPIHADDLRPARETCERCHFPEKFSDDSLREIKHFGNDPNNTPTSIYLTLKTGGGTKRLGLGRGIHWHIENQVYYLALDRMEQQIPYVEVIEEDGSVTEYLEVGSEIDPETIEADELRLMDCITCHNRITHMILTPEATIDKLLTRGVVSSTIPEIRRKAVEVLRASYPSNKFAVNGIAGLEGYYKAYYPDFYANNSDLIDIAIATLQEAYLQSVFPEQQADWTTHSNNIGHVDSPGCFRCHDGKHLNPAGEAIRLECNLCHSIPIVAGPTDFVVDIEISRGPEPESHLHANWISLHRDIFDATCANCHTTQNPGGTDDSSFCANSACHGSAWPYAGFDAPGLREMLLNQFPLPPEPIPPMGPLTYNEVIGPLFQQRCGDCHGANGIQGLNLEEYATTMEGGLSGPAIVPGDAEGSLLVVRLTGEQPHFGQLSPEELEWVIDWINSGATEE